MKTTENTAACSPMTRQERLARLGPDHADTVVTVGDTRRAALSRALVSRDVAGLFSQAITEVTAMRAARDAEVRAACNADGLDVWG